MSYKLKQDSIGGFSEKVASTLCNGFYATKKRADGAALMKFTDSKQVNSFLVKILFEKWQAETQNLESPYLAFICQAPSSSEIMISVEIVVIIKNGKIWVA